MTTTAIAITLISLTAPQTDPPIGDHPSAADELLLDMLGDDSTSHPPHAEQRPNREPVALPTSDDDLLLQDVGEDIGKESEAHDHRDPASDIAHRMVRAGRLISQRESASATRELQQGILRDLDAMIRQAGRKPESSGG